MLITVQNTDMKVTVALKGWTKCKYNLGRIFFVTDSAIMFFPVGFFSPILFCCFFWLRLNSCWDLTVGGAVILLPTL